jgi:hypothetical protein
MKSDRYGEHPFGTHWTPGKVREVSDADAADAPKWLKPAPAKKASKKTKTPEPEATTEG